MNFIDMENLLIYFFKASIGIVLFYFFYYLVLRKETFYTSNRLYLLAGLILAVMLPAMPISYTSPIALVEQVEFFSESENSLNTSEMPKIEESQTMALWQDPYMVFAAIYIAGAAFFLIWLIVQTVIVTLQIRHGKMKLLDGVAVIDIKRKVMPFSFFNSVIINSKEYSKEELSHIIAHEKVHIQERHWVDLLIIELLTVVFWMNPIVWLYEKSIKQNHEYLADQGVLLAGYHRGQYQASLINQLMGVKILGFTNNLNFSLNKGRMEMMKKEKSPGFKKVKLLFALPLIALLMFAFAKKEYTLPEQKTNIASDQASAQKEIILDKPVYITGDVITSDGTPIEGAAFTHNGAAFNGLSDRKGHFIFEIPKGFNYYETELDFGDGKKRKGMLIHIRHPGYANSSMLLDLRKKIELLKVWMSKNISVNGQVRNHQDRPLVNTSITLRGTDTSTTTNRQGEFEIDAAEGGILTISHRGYNTIDFALVGDNLLNPTIYMRAEKNRTIPVNCTVTGKNGKPLEGVNVLIRNSNTGTTTDANGKFSLKVPDSTTLIMSHIGYKTATPRYSSAFTHNTNVTFGITLAERAYRIMLPDATNESLKMQPPPAPPPKNIDKNQVFIAYEEMPYYSNGGIPKLALDLKKEIKFVLNKTKDRGEVLVGFTVNAKGKIADAHVIESASSKMLDESAVKIVAKLDNWWAGMQRDKRVPVDLTIPVKFE